MSTFAEQLDRLKEQLQVSMDTEVAELLGMSKTAFNERKRRNSFPTDKLQALANRRPELGLDPPYVLTGKKSQERVKARLQAFPLRLAELRGAEALESFAERVGIPANVLAQLESGRAMPTSDHVIQLIRAFPEHSPSWIAGGDKPTLDEELTYLEVVLIRNYRQCSKDDQDALRRAAAAGAAESLE